MDSISLFLLPRFQRLGTFTMMIITSRSNPKILEAAQLKEKKFRDQQKAFLVDGIKLFDEAVASGAEIKAVFALAQFASYCENKVGDRAEVFEITQPVLEKLTQEKSPEGVVCVVSFPSSIHVFTDVYSSPAEGDRIEMMWSVRDPGNMGTILRSAAAFGVDTLIISSDCADIYNPRTVRGSMGAIFRQKVVVCSDFCGTVAALKSCGYSIYAALPSEKALPISKIPLGRKVSFIIGNEGHGLTDEIIETAGNAAYIPMSRGTESLNAAIAASVIMYERSRSEDI